MARVRNPLPRALRDLPLAEVARQVGRSKSTVQRWVREGRVSEGAKDRVARAGTRLAAIPAPWRKTFERVEEQRRTAQRRAAGRKGGVATAQSTAATRSRDDLLGTARDLHGKNINDRVVLAEMIRVQDARWTLHLANVLLRGMDVKDARNSWFSPKGRRKR
jgi:hypothetical protein